MNIKINRDCVQFLSPIIPKHSEERKVIYTIWEDDFNKVIEAISHSRDYNRKQKMLDEEFKHVGYQLTKKESGDK